MLDKSSYTPLFRQAFDIICTRIIQGVYPEGNILPSQSEFADEFDVSMITMRQAFKDLNEKKIIFSKKGVGSIVLKKPEVYLGHHTERGLTLDSKMYNYSLKSKIIKILPRCKHIEASFILGIEDLPPICINRLRLMEEKKISLDFSFLNPQLLQKTDWEAEFKDNVSLYKFINDNYGYNIIRAEESILPIISPKEIIDILELEQPLPIFFIKRETYIEGINKPIEYCENYILPEYYGKIIYSIKPYDVFH